MTTMTTTNTTVPRGTSLITIPHLQARSRIPSSSFWKKRTVAVWAASPQKISEKISESVKAAEEKCSDDPRSGECVAAWDEVEELSAAASHARDRLKEGSVYSGDDQLEKYCKENPGMGQCRIYED